MLSSGTVSYSSSLNPPIQDRSRPPVGMTQSGSHALGGSSGTGMSSYAYSPNAAPSTSSGLSMGGPLNDTMSQSRPQYQPGYLLSLAQSQNVQPTQRHEETHLIPTRAKMNPAFPRNSSTDFGTESMFESSSKQRHREALDDEDGPPTTSVTDIINETPYRQNSQNLFSATRASDERRNRATSTPPPPSHQTLHVIVFGYPPSRLSITAAHFQSIAEGGTTEPEMSLDVENAFKIGYKHPWEAARAWRRNGEIISGEGGRWMVGVKWADPQLAEQMLGSGARSFMSPSTIKSTETPPFTPSNGMDTSPDPSTFQLQRLGQLDGTPSIGTPIKLAPSATAFRKGGTDSGRKVVHTRTEGTAVNNGSPSKSVIGQVSDLIFGW